MLLKFNGGDQTQETMTSLLIAEITGKTHSHVMRDCKKLSDTLEKEGETKFGLANYIDSQGKTRQMYQLTKEQTYLLVTGYSAPLRLKVIRRLEELEQKNKVDTKELSRLEILTMALESEKRAIEAESKVAILMHVNKTYTATEIAKEIGLASANKLNEILCDKKIQYKQNGTWVPFSKYSELGYFDIKQEVLDNGRIIYHRRITQLGRDFILKLFK